MRLASLFSGGKDSTYALYLAQKQHHVVCLVTLASHNQESYMFHTPNIHSTSLQAQALGIPQIIQHTPGIKEKEIDELRIALEKAKVAFGIQGVVTGAVESIYQATRIQKICADLGLVCFNPLWKIDQVELLHELCQNGFDVRIAAVAAYPFDQEWLGKKIDDTVIKKLVALQTQFRINPAGEGGEIETVVLDAPHFNKKLVPVKTGIVYDNHAGVWQLQHVELMEK